MSACLGMISHAAKSKRNVLAFREYLKFVVDIPPPIRVVEDDIDVESLIKTK